MEESGEEIGAPPQGGGSSSENGTERPRLERLKLEEQPDRISDLPDSLIHHILSLLPSSKEAIRTGTLSKRWQNQWTRVPDLIFDSTGMSNTNFSQFMDTTLTLHDCSKIKKFHIKYYSNLYDPYLTSKIRFATRKNVEELMLHLNFHNENGQIFQSELPEFLFNNASLVKLELFRCSIGDNQITNWSSLKELKLECSFVSNLAIGNIVSGCPLLESLELSVIIGFHNLVIASKSLERLIFVDVKYEYNDEHIEISCPNLVELSIKFSRFSPDIYWTEFYWSEFPDEAIENVLSRSPLLHTLELADCWCSNRLLIASKSLKRLILGKIYGTSEFEISCPNLEELNLYHFVVDVFFRFNDFEPESGWERCLALKILEQLQHVKLLEIGSWFLEFISALEVEAPSSPLLNCKCLTLDGNFDEHLLGIVYAIQNSPELENLVIKLQPVQSNKLVYIWDLDGWRKKKYRNSNETVFKCSVSNLKTVKIVGLSEMDESPRKCLFNFIEFMLKNARMLAKILIIFAENCGTGFLYEVSKKLISFQRCFPHTTIELLRFN